MAANLPTLGNSEAQPGGPPAPAVRDPLLLTKFGGDWNKADESYRNAVSEIGRTHQLADSATQRAERAEAALAQLAGGRPTNDATDPLEVLRTELGLPPEPFARAIDARAKAIVETTLHELFGPMQQAMDADEKLAGEIDNFEQLRGEARKYMREDPETAAVFNAVRKSDPGAAWKFAIQKTAIAKGITQPARATHAGLPGGMSPQGRAPENPSGPEQGIRENEALEYGKAYGDMAPYRAERFKGTSVERAVRNALRQAGLVPEGEAQGW